MILTLEDAITRLEILHFPDKNHTDASWSLETIYFMVCEKSLDRYTGHAKLSTQALYTEDLFRMKIASKLQLTLTPKTSLLALQTLLKAHPGRCHVMFYYQNEEMRVALSPWSEGITLSEALVSALIDLGVHFDVIYDQKGLNYV